MGHLDDKGSLLNLIVNHVYVNLLTVLVVPTKDPVATDFQEEFFEDDTQRHHIQSGPARYQPC